MQIYERSAVFIYFPRANSAACHAQPNAREIKIFHFTVIFGSPAPNVRGKRILSLVPNGRNATQTTTDKNRKTEAGS